MALAAFLLGSEPMLARSPVFARILTSVVPDFESARLLAVGFRGRPDLTGDPGFYPVPALRRWPQRQKDVLFGQALNPARMDFAAILRFLLDHGADPNGSDWLGDPMVFNALKGRPDALPTLDFMLSIRPCPTLDVRDQQGRTLLQEAVQTGLGLDKLLAAGADPDFRDSQGDTPLSFAVSAGLLPEAKRLVEAGADPFLLPRPGLPSPYRVAQLDHLEDLVALIEGRHPERKEGPQPPGAPNLWPGPEQETLAPDGFGILVQAHWVACAPGRDLVGSCFVNRSVGYGKTTLGIQFGEDEAAWNAGTGLGPGQPFSAEVGSRWMSLGVRAVVPPGVTRARLFIQVDGWGPLGLAGMEFRQPGAVPAATP